MTGNPQLDGIAPASYAPYDDPRDYITSWTDRIWITRGLGHLRDHYAPDVKVHTAYGETYGFDDVMRNSIQRMSAFPNRGGGHDDVVWEQRGPNGFVSSHRVFNSGARPGRHDAECAMVAEMFDRVWNGRYMDEVPRIFADTVAIQSVRLRRAMGIAPYQNELIDLLAAFPDGQVQVRTFPPTIPPVLACASRPSGCCAAPIAACPPTAR